MSLADGGNEFRLVLDGPRVNPRHRRQGFDHIDRLAKVIVDGHDSCNPPQVVVPKAIGADRMKSGSNSAGRRGASARSNDQQLGL